MGFSEDSFTGMDSSKFDDGLARAPVRRHANEAGKCVTSRKGYPGRAFGTDQAVRGGIIKFPGEEEFDEEFRNDTWTSHVILEFLLVLVLSGAASDTGRQECVARFPERSDEAVLRQRVGPPPAASQAPAHSASHGEDKHSFKIYLLAHTINFPQFSLESQCLSSCSRGRLRSGKSPDRAENLPGSSRSPLLHPYRPNLTLNKNTFHAPNTM